uniref:Uncharacterized protein n=1 Tax=Amphimedon queenslandica TaxID=400682 RepID=A0A1X7UBA4_AMPQE
MIRIGSEKQGMKNRNQKPPIELSFISLSCRNWLILPTNEDKLVYLVCSSLSVSAFLLSPEDLYRKVLMYGSASVAEEVCHLNRWDQCSLPLNALETGLELRQLDIVSFFLRNRDRQNTACFFV